MTLIFSIVSLFSFSGCGSEGTPSDTQLVGGTQEAYITSIVVTPGDIMLPVGAEGAFIAEAHYSDDRHEDVTSQATWFSSDTAVLSIVETGDNAGYAKALTLGHSDVRATFSGITSNTTDVTVVSASLISLNLNPVLKSVANGFDVEYKVLGLFSDGRTTDLTVFSIFSSNNTDIVRFINKGLFSGLAFTQSPGIARITASYHGLISNNARLAVTDKVVTKVEIEPAFASLPKGTHGSFSAIAYFSDRSREEVTHQALWRSSDRSVIGIFFLGEHAGYAIAKDLGNANITAIYGGVTSNISNITVTQTTLQRIQIDPVNESVPNGINVKYRATGIYLDGTTRDLTLFAVFKSSNTAVATVGGRGAVAGTAITHERGTSMITAGYNDVSSNEATLTVTAAIVTSIQVEPADISVPVGIAGPYKATAYFSDKTSQDVTTQSLWTSGDADIVNIQTGGENAGYAEALAEGNTTITAKYDAILSNIAKIEVTRVPLESIQLTPTNESLPVGLTLQLQAIGIYSNGTDVNLTEHVDYESTTRDVIVDSEGLVTARVIGAADIIASYEGVSSNISSIKVTQPIAVALSVTPSNEQVPNGTTEQFTATATLSDNSTEDVTNNALWESSNPLIIAISTYEPDSGSAEALSPGTASISAEYVGINSNDAPVEVTDVTLETIDVTPSTERIADGLTVQYTAIGTFSDNTNKDLTSEVTWSSNDTGIATISEAGLATGVALGTATISANHTLQQLINLSSNTSATLEVTDAVLQSIVIDPVIVEESVGTEVQMTATGSYDDTTDHNITNDVTWTTSDYFIAEITQSGVLRLMSNGDANITATLDNISNTVTVTGTVLP